MKLAFHLTDYLECSFWVMCNLLWVFIKQLRSHIWRGWYQQGISGSHASIMGPVKLGHYTASVINPCDQYTPLRHALIYEWQNLTRGQLRWVAADHMIPALKSQGRNVDKLPLRHPHLTSLKKLWCPISQQIPPLSAPSCSPHMCSDAEEGNGCCSWGVLCVYMCVCWGWGGRRHR